MQSELYYKEYLNALVEQSDVVFVVFKDEESCEKAQELISFVHKMNKNAVVKTVFNDFLALGEFKFDFKMNSETDYT